MTTKIVKYFLLGIFVLSSIWRSSGYQFAYSDKSHETLIRPRRQLEVEETTKQGCVTPTQPTNGRWFYFDRSDEALPHQNVSVNTTIGFECKSGFLLSSYNEDAQFLTCTDGKWNVTSIPFCNQLCPPFYNSSAITVSCKQTGTDVIVPCDKAIDGTWLTYECATHYKPSSLTKKDLLCFGAKWDYAELPLCVPECGQKALKATPLIVGGNKSKRGKYPWVIALYSSKDSDPYFTNICGGTLLTTDIVLTAAHCVARQLDGRIYNAKYFRVSAGKYFNVYEDSRDSDTAQTSRVEKVVAHSEYKGERQHFRFDIALLKLETPFNLSNIILPACYLGLTQYVPDEDALGVVSGWGYTTSNGEPSDVLKYVDLPIRDRDNCYKDFEEDWADQFFTEEKMCAGYLNQSTSVCKGDSGGGLVLEHPRDRRYYVHGIVSLGFSFVENNEKRCDIQKNALFTKVDLYIGWMKNKIKQLGCEECNNTTLGLSTEGCDFCFCLKKFCPSNSSLDTSFYPGLTPRAGGCVTPPQPTNGAWVYLHSKNQALEGQVVAENILINFSCKKGFILSTSASLVVCQQDGWSMKTIPQCIRLCPPIYNTTLNLFKCFDKQSVEIPCDEATNGTYVTPGCVKPQDVLEIRRPRINCIDGNWETAMPECVKGCGDKLLSYRVADPWEILIYSNKSDKLPQHTCSGTLLKEDIVLTAAQCITSDDGRPENTTYYSVTTASPISAYIDPRNPKADFFGVEKIVVHPNYAGKLGRFHSDIAILKLKQPFTRALTICFKGLQPRPLKEISKVSVTDLGYASGKLKFVVRKEITVPLLNYSSCISELGENVSYFTKDKKCAGVLNQSLPLCKLHSGTGLDAIDPSTYRSYIQGVTSQALADETPDGCSINQPIVFTDIRGYINWLEEEIDRLAVS